MQKKNEAPRSHEVIPPGQTDEVSHRKIIILFAPRCGEPDCWSGKLKPMKSLFYRSGLIRLNDFEDKIIVSLI